MQCEISKYIYTSKSTNASFAVSLYSHLSTLSQHYFYVPFTTFAFSLTFYNKTITFCFYLTYFSLLLPGKKSTQFQYPCKPKTHLSCLAPQDGGLIFSMLTLYRFHHFYKKNITGHLKNH